MKIVRRLVAGKHLKTLKRPGATEKEIEEAKSQLAAGGVGVIPAVLELVRDRDATAHVPDVLASVLCDATLPAFLEAIASEDTAIATTATEVLSSSRSYDPSPLLLELSRAGTARPRIEAILQARGTELPLRKLLPSLEDETNESRDVIYRLIESHGDESMVPHVTRMLEHEDVWVRTHAIKLLERFPNETSMAGLQSALRDPVPGVRLAAVRALESVGNRLVIPDLCNSLRDGDLKVHAAAIDALTAMGDVSAVPHLVDVLKDESEYARRGAVEVLNEVATTEAIKDLVCALRDADWWVRVRAADALGSLGGERVVEALLELLENEDDFIRRYAVEILITVHDARAVEPLIGRLRDTDWWVRERAIDALASIGDARAVEPLIEVLTIDPDAAPLCARALGGFVDERAIAPLCRAAESATTELAQEAVTALQALARADLPQDRRREIREALAVIGAPPIESRMAPTPLNPRSAPDPEIGLRRPGASPAPALTPPAEHGGQAPRPDRTIAVRSPAMTGSGSIDPSENGPNPSPVAPATPLNLQALAEGVVLMNRYRIIRKIGSGGFGSVYLVEDTTVSDEVILKILSPHICQDPTVIQRFVHELKYTRRITHRNVIRLFDFLQFDGAHAISMEYFSGADLSHHLRRGALGPERTVAIASQVCAGLIAAHEEGIVHRDIKPPNILVDDDNHVKIVDFGLASMAQNAGSQLTRSGIIIGTPQYMAPEQITGDKTDARTDLYSLGVVMFEMLTATAPFKGENAVNILFQHLEGQAPDMRELAPDVPEELEQLVLSAMSRDREARPQSAAALLDSLEALAPLTSDD